MKPPLHHPGRVARVIEPYRDAKGEWRWRAWAGGRIVETGAEGYASRRNVMRAIRAKLAAHYRLVP